jgi:hypothetical protein
MEFTKYKFVNWNDLSNVARRLNYIHYDYHPEEFRRIFDCDCGTQAGFIFRKESRAVVALVHVGHLDELYRRFPEFSHMASLPDFMSTKVYDDFYVRNILMVHPPISWEKIEQILYGKSTSVKSSKPSDDFTIGWSR